MVLNKWGVASEIFRFFCILKFSVNLEVATFNINLCHQQLSSSIYIEILTGMYNNVTAGTKFPSSGDFAARFRLPDDYNIHLSNRHQSTSMHYFLPRFDVGESDDT